MDNTEISIECPTCHTISPQGAYFCYNCGQALRPKPESLTIGKQLVIYLISFFLAPFGLGYAFKYLRQSDSKSKAVGITVVVLTALALIIFLWVAKQSIESTYRSIQIINTL